MTVDPRGVLYPARLPEFHRLLPPPELAQAVRWFWIPEWDLGPGIESRQEVLPFPACHIVIESEVGGDPDSGAGIGAGSVHFSGPPTRRSERVLAGSGWAIGAYLLPAVAPRFAELTPGSVGLAMLREAYVTLAEPDLAREVAAAMAGSGSAEADGDERRARAVAIFGEWIHHRLPSPTEAGELANRLGELVANPEITRVDQLPGLLHVSPRTLQRIAYHHFGLSPHSMIRRRRLQEGAARLREEPGLAVAELAAALGYSDHAHFTHDFTAVLGVAPTQYRARTVTGQPQPNVQ